MSLPNKINDIVNKYTMSLSEDFKDFDEESIVGTIAALAVSILASKTNATPEQLAEFFVQLGYNNVINMVMDVRSQGLHTMPVAGHA